MKTVYDHLVSVAAENERLKKQNAELQRELKTFDERIGNTWQGKTDLEREQIAIILRDNITYSGQIDGYVIHGAIDKIIEWANAREISNLKKL